MVKYEISKKELKPNDVIILTFDIEDSFIDLDDARDIYKSIKEQFPNNKVVGLIKDVELDFKDWEYTYNYVMSIKPKQQEKIVNI